MDKVKMSAVVKAIRPEMVRVRSSAQNALSLSKAWNEGRVNRDLVALAPPFALFFARLVRFAFLLPAAEESFLS